MNKPISPQPQMLWLTSKTRDRVLLRPSTISNAGTNRVPVMIQTWSWKHDNEVNPVFILMEVHPFNALYLWFSDFRMYQNHLQSLLKHRGLGSSSNGADPVSLQWGLRKYRSNRLPGNANDSGTGSTLRTPHWLRPCLEDQCTWNQRKCTWDS